VTFLLLPKLPFYVQNRFLNGPYANDRYHFGFSLNGRKNFKKGLPNFLEMLNGLYFFSFKTNTHRGINKNIDIRLQKKFVFVENSGERVCRWIVNATISKSCPDISITNNIFIFPNDIICMSNTINSEFYFPFNFIF
jgi:hypothetical protein